MVCAEVEKVIVSKIEGGFVLVPVATLMAAWMACRARPLGMGDFRTWLACHEASARRCRPGSRKTPTYSIRELSRLLDVTEKRAKASVRRLVLAGLIQWSHSSIAVPEPASRPDHLQDSIGQGRGSLAIPRRVLRFLTRRARPALIATTLGVLLRCLGRRKAGFDGRGRVKASWIARTFAVDLRRVKAARLELVALGWLRPEQGGQRAENRWGKAYRVDLAWSRGESGGRNLPPRPGAARIAIATPSVDREPLPERGEDQEPAAGGLAGVEIPGKGDGDGPLPMPSLDDIRSEDLRDSGRLLELHRQAAGRGLASPSEDGRLAFVAVAEHARAVGTVNPAGLFAALIRKGLYRYATSADEDRARARLRDHLHGQRASPGRPMASTWSSPGLSEDARIVREVRAGMIRAGIYRDPWPAFQARNPAWDRGRWDAGLVELGLG